MPRLRPSKRRRVVRPLLPTGAQLIYLKELRSILAFTSQLVKDRLIPRLDDASVRLDAKPRTVNRVIDQLSEAVFRRLSQERMERIAAKVASATNEHQKQEWQKQVKGLTGVELKAVSDRGIAPLTRNFLAENVALIKTVPQKYLDEVERLVLLNMQNGGRAADLQAQLQERLGVAESRARLIARDQVLKFNGALNRIRQQQAGVSKYIWRTSKDNRVREEHADLEGEVFSWNEPPGGENPGDAVNCRCFPEPYLEDLLAEE